MFKKKFVFLTALAAVAVLAAACTRNDSYKGSADIITQEPVATGEDGKKDDKMEGETEPADGMASAGTYQTYSPALLAEAQASGRKPVLFFYATWCPFCRTADAAFRKNLSALPAGVTLLKVDYDASAELKQKYGITYQHTFVQVDASGQALSKWNGGDIDNLNKYLK